MKATRRSVLKAVREEFNLPAVNYSEERVEYYRAKFYNLPVTVFSAVTFYKLKTFMKKNYPEVVVKYVSALTIGSGSGVKSLVLEFNKRQFN